MSNEELVNLIQSKHPEAYPNDKVHILTSGLEKMSPLIKKALETFLRTNEHKEINLLGYSIQNLIAEQSMNEIAAYLTLDWIIREPDKAIKSLKKGHDIVGSSNS